MSLVRQFMVAAAAIAASAAAFAHEPGPHVHGVARLQIALDGPLLTLFLDSPLDNLLGFEHFPSTEKQKAAVAALDSRLRRAQSVFLPTPAARCASTSVKLESPVFTPKAPAAGDGHADLKAEYVFRCELPERLKDVDVRLFDGFPHMRRIEVQVAGPRGQASATLEVSRHRVNL